MSRNKSFQWSAIAVAVVLASLTAGRAQSLTPITQILTSSTGTLTGNASAVRSTVLGTTAALADTGALTGTTDVRDASLDTGSIPSVLSGEVLRAVTIGWPDQVASEASIANLAMTIGGTGVSADFLMARAMEVSGAAGSGSSIIHNLSIGGVPIWVTGLPNQRVWIPGGQVLINEQTVSPVGTTVNALHATVFGVADVVIASATAGIP